MRRLILIFLVVIAAGGATGAWASDPPTLPPEVTCSTDVAAMRQQAAQQGVQLPTNTPDGTMACFYPEHAR